MTRRQFDEIRLAKSGAVLEMRWGRVTLREDGARLWGGRDGNSEGGDSNRNGEDECKENGDEKGQGVSTRWVGDVMWWFDGVSETCSKMLPGFRKDPR